MKDGVVVFLHDQPIAEGQDPEHIGGDAHAISPAHRAPPALDDGIVATGGDAAHVEVQVCHLVAHGTQGRLKGWPATPAPAWALDPGA